ncbi:hypothetical protein Moror_15097 [Moniliophthora roreri MCA 2997]|uniref:Tc1-like transposase DDE domain-containing protein n=1 Tax=Moniliophthora roreri (strain MCA 2997) TaxID=1381753 RepID=V2WZ29_MONRO|nr:hypothetical protein Moror_15097 [Moniliophthora roreri MCA 2997]
MVDKTSFDNFRWSYEGTRAQVVAPYQGHTQYSLCAAIGLDGVLHMNIIEGFFTVITFHQFILGLLDKMNPYSGCNSVILMDNVSIHHLDETLNMIEEQ